MLFHMQIAAIPLVPATVSNRGFLQNAAFHLHHQRAWWWGAGGQGSTVVTARSPSDCSLEWHCPCERFGCSLSLEVGL